MRANFGFGALAKKSAPSAGSGRGGLQLLPEAGGRLIEWLDLHDRRAVVTADPKHRPRAGLLDEDAADIGGPRQQILGTLVTAAEQILDWLRGTRAPLSGQELARRLGCSRTAIWKHVAALRRAGYGIDARRAAGYVLSTVPDRLGPTSACAASWPGSGTAAGSGARSASTSTATPGRLVTATARMGTPAATTSRNQPRPSERLVASLGGWVDRWARWRWRRRRDPDRGARDQPSRPEGSSRR